MWKSLLNDEPQIYPISKDVYDRARREYRRGILSTYSEAEVGWVGFMASYNGRFFDGGYSGNGVRSKDGGARNYIDESIADVLRQAERLRGVEFRCCSYDCWIFLLVLSCILTLRTEIRSNTIRLISIMNGSMLGRKSLLKLGTKFS